MNKKSILEEFKKKSISSTKINEADVKTENEIEKNIIKDDNFINEVTKKNLDNIYYSNPKFKEFKENFLKDEKAKNLMILFDKLRSEDVVIFEDDFFIYQKMKDKNIKLILLEPTYDDVMLNKKEMIFLVKPIYPTEYQEFIKEYKSREANPVKFMEFVIKKGTLFPVVSEDINKIFTSGQVLSIYDTIINMSDLNKRYRIIEV